MRVVLRLRGSPGWLRRIETASPVIEMTAEEKFRRLVNAALGTPFYSRRDWTYRLLEARRLVELPVVPAREVLDGRDAFLNPRATKAMAMLRLPFVTTGCVLMGRKMRTPERTTYLEEGLLGRLHLSQTRMLAGTPAVLRRICASIEARTLAMPQICEAVVVLQGVAEGVLFEGERDMLWRCFGVPVFEQWLGLDGELLAWECGAHQGLHFQSGRAELEEVDGELALTSWYGLRTPVLRLGTGMVAEADARVCRCGDDRPLIHGLRWKRGCPNPQHAVAAAS